MNFFRCGYRQTGKYPQSGLSFQKSFSRHCRMILQRNGLLFQLLTASLRGWYRFGFAVADGACLCDPFYSRHASSATHFWIAADSWPLFFRVKQLLPASHLWADGRFHAYSEDAVPVCVLRSLRVCHALFLRICRFERFPRFYSYLCFRPFIKIPY